MTLTEAYKQVRSQYPTTSAHQCLLIARGLLETQARHRFGFSVEEGEVQTIQHGGFFVVVEVKTDEYHEWDDDYRGEIYGFGKGEWPSNWHFERPQGQFVFERSTGRWSEDVELVGFDLGGGETFKGLLSYYRGHLSKQVAFETAMRDVKSQFKYALEFEEARHDRYNDNFWAYGVTAKVYESEEAYEEDEHSYLAEDSLWGIEVDSRRWRETQDYISERAWDCIEVAVGQAQRAEFNRIKAAGNVPLFEGV